MIVTPLSYTKPYSTLVLHILLKLIIVTGPGHSGTRVIARIYDMLGFGPSHYGFHFQESGDTVEIGQLNQEISNALGTGFRGRHQFLERIFGRYDPYPRVLDWSRLERVARSFRNEILDYSIRCNLSGDERLPSARDTLAILYLEYTQCLQIPKKSFVDSDEDIVYQDYDENVYPVPFSSQYQLAVERESAGLRGN